jgi:iron complex outermembrane receptor protein
MHVWNRVDLVQGFSYDWRNTEQARGFNSSTAPYGMIYYPDSQAQASNGQLAAIWRYNDTDKVYLDFSDRTRFPTLFERYSTRFGLAIANAALKPERAANVQLGWEGLFAPRLKVSAAIYGSIVEDMIETVGITVPGKGATTQSQNVGLGHIVGADFKADYAVNDDLAVGGQLGLIHREVKATPAVVLTGVPGVSGFLYASWRVLPQLTLTPSVSVASDRGSANYNTTAYVQTGAYTLLNFKAEYKPLANVSLYAGAKNLLDRLYVLTDGYPEAGRTIYLGARYSF